MKIDEFLQKDMRTYLDDVKAYGHAQDHAESIGTSDLLAPKTPAEIKKEQQATKAQAQGKTEIHMDNAPTSTSASTPTEIKAEKVIVKEEREQKEKKKSKGSDKSTKTTKKEPSTDILPPPPPTANTQTPQPVSQPTPQAVPVDVHITQKESLPPLPKFENDKEIQEKKIIAEVASEAAAKTAARLEEKAKQEEQARKKAEEEAKKKAEEEQKRKEAEEKVKAQKEALQAAQAKKKAAADARKAKEEQDRKNAEEARKQQELERIKHIADAKKRQMLEEKMRVEDARRRVLEEKKRQEALRKEQEHKEREAREAEERKKHILAEKKRKEEQRQNNLKKHEEPLVDKIRKEEQGLKEAFQLEDYNAAVRHYRRLKRDAPTLHYHPREQNRIYEQLKELALRIPSLQVVELHEDDLSQSLPKPKDKSAAAPKPITGDFHHLYLQAVKAIDKGDKRKALQLLIALAKDRPTNLAVKIHLKEALAL